MFTGANFSGYKYFKIILQILFIFFHFGKIF